MNKKLNASGIFNELTGASSFFKNEPPAQTTPDENSLTLQDRTEIRTEKRSENRTAGLPTKRRTKRYSFEFFEDQVIALKRLKYEADMAGDRVNMSDFARDALDKYLKDKNLL